MARPSVDLQTQQLEEEMGNCLEKGKEVGGGALQTQEVAPPASGQFKPLLLGGS